MDYNFLYIPSLGNGNKELDSLLKSMRKCTPIYVGTEYLANCFTGRAAHKLTELNVLDIKR